MANSKPKLLYFVTEDWYFLSHRLPIAKRAINEGFDVFVAVNITDEKHATIIKNYGFNLIPLKLSRGSINPFIEAAFLLKLIFLYRRVRPDIVHHVALKPILYGSVAAFFAKTSAVVNAVTGLGHVFIDEGMRASFLRKIVLAFYGLAFKRKNTLNIFQNPDDLDYFVSRGAARAERCFIIKGSGVDLHNFSPPENEPSGPPVFLLASRMLWTKGFGDFVEAARIVRRKRITCRMVIAGEPDVHNPAAIARETIEQWVKDGYVEYWGKIENMAEAMKEISVAVLPSYREGVPKYLIEAAAAGRPVIAYDIPGCREIVRHEKNGFLAPFRDAHKLAEYIEALAIDEALRKEMGNAGRAFAAAEFGDKAVADKTLALYQLALKSVREQ